MQTVSLRGFDTNGEQISLDYPGPAGPIVLTRGTTYNAAGIEAAVETLTGRNVTITQWGYDPYGDYVQLIAPVRPVDDTGFQVVFGADRGPGGLRRRR